MHLRPPSGLLWATKLYIFCKASGINAKLLCSNFTSNKHHTLDGIMPLGRYKKLNHPAD
jgi:hypothetical protein